MKDNQKRNLSDKVIMTRLLKYAMPFKKNFIISFALILVAVILDVLIPIFMGKTITLLTGDDIDYTNIIILCIVFLVSILLVVFTEYKQTMLLQKTGQGIMFNIREEVFGHIEKLSIAQINEIPTGKLVTRVTNDTNTLNEMYTSVLINLVKNILSLVGITIAMLIVNIKLALLVLAVCPFVAILSIIFRKYSRRAYREVRENLSNVNAFLSENLSGMKITQIFNQENKKYNEFDERNTALKKSSIKEILIFGIFRPTMYGLYVVATILVLYFGSKLALDKVIEVGVLVTFTTYISRFFNPIQQLAEQFNVLQSAFASSERIFEVLDTVPNVVDTDGAIELDEVKGKIEFRNVWFKYTEDEWILKDVSFVVNPKESCAFVGATGAGKTTILGLLVRNYDIQKGDIFLDDINIKDIKISSLRKNIGQMLQDVFLFSGDIYSNITLGEEVTFEEVKEACDYVNATTFINKLEDGFDSKVRERGNNFSSGQRQLLSFARTIVHKPNIMILDEATANIDTETEVLIQESLSKMMNIGTMLIVAHRLSTIQHCDNIIVLHHGRIIESGTHQELLKKHGYYFNLYKLQFANK